MGIQKHRKSGHSVNSNHFTGVKGSGTRRKHRTSRKQRKMNRGRHQNRYKQNDRI